MAHFAELDENNIVLRVIVGVDEQHDGKSIYQQDESAANWAIG